VKSEPRKKLPNKNLLKQQSSRLMNNLLNLH